MSTFHIATTVIINVNNALKNICIINFTENDLFIISCFITLLQKHVIYIMLFYHYHSIFNIFKICFDQLLLS